MNNVPKEGEYFCVAKCRFKTPKKYGQQGFVADLVNVVVKDKKL